VRAAVILLALLRHISKEPSVTFVSATRPRKTARQVTSTGDALPSPRNAAVGAPLSGGGGKLDLMIHGGWKAFVETYSDTFILSMD